MRSKVLILALFAIASTALLTAACSGDDDNTNTPGATTAAGSSQTAGASQPQDITITASDFKFDKTTISAAAGQTINITFKNTGSATHSFTVGTTDVAQAAGGESKSGSFTASTSTIEFHCKFHSSMTGTITLGGASGAIGTNPPSSPAAAGIGGYSY
jgi:plastocyanin